MSDVCVIVAAFNASSTICAAVDSALAQERVAVEVIAVDDASTDGTLRQLENVAAADRRLKVLSNTRNAGPAAARNRALEATRARYVTVLDSDDRMEPGRLAAMLALAKEGDWDMVADDLHKVTEHGKSAARTRMFSKHPIGARRIDLEAFVRGNLTRLHGGRGEMGFFKPLIRRDFLIENRLGYDESMRLGEDYALYAMALAAGASFLLVDPLGYDALTRADSLSGRHCAADLGALVAADRRMGNLPGLSAAERSALREHEIETQKRWRWLWLIEAVKARDVSQIAQCMAAPPQVIMTILGKLAEQAFLRSRGALLSADAGSTRKETR